MINTEDPFADAFADAVVERTRKSLVGVRRLGVAFSGGVDSSVLVALAVRALGVDRVVPILGVSPSLSAEERLAAHQVARTIGIAVIEVATYEGERAAYVANGPDRCFHCKDELFSRISGEVVTSQRLDAVAYGENADDAARPDRPGARAATDHRVLRPLADTGLSKADVRRLARTWQLPCADKPAAPCLASRIPHHEIVSPGSCGRSNNPRPACAVWDSTISVCATTVTSLGSSCSSMSWSERAPNRAAPRFVPRFSGQASASPWWIWPGYSPAASP